MKKIVTWNGILDYVEMTVDKQKNIFSQIRIKITKVAYHYKEKTYLKVNRRPFRRPQNEGRSVRDMWKRARWSSKTRTIRVPPKYTKNFAYLCAKFNRNAQNSLHCLRSSTQRECTSSDIKK